jgi:hypothetical protein
VLAGAYAQKDYRSEIFNTVGYTTMNLGRSVPQHDVGLQLAEPGRVERAGDEPHGGLWRRRRRDPDDRSPATCLRNWAWARSARRWSSAATARRAGPRVMSCQDLSYVIVPRLVRAEQVVGSRDRTTGMLNARMAANQQSCASSSTRSCRSPTTTSSQYDVMLTVRSYNNNVPIKFATDQNNVLTSGTFGNAYFLNQSTDAQTYTKLFYRSLSGEWDVARNLQVLHGGHDQHRASSATTRSSTTLQSAAGQVQPTVYAPGVAAPAGGGPASNLTPLNTGQYAVYSYTPGDLTPRLSSSIDLPTYTGWNWNSIQIAPNKQDLEQKSFRADLVWGDARWIAVSAGVMKSKFDRHIATWNTSGVRVPQQLHLDVRLDGDLAAGRRSERGDLPVPDRPAVHEPVQGRANRRRASTTAGRSIDFDKLRKAVNFDYYMKQTNPGDQPANYLNTYSPRILTEETSVGLSDGGGQPRDPRPGPALQRRRALH